MRMRGDDLERLKQYAGRFATLVGTLPDVTEATTELEQAREEIQLEIDENLAGQAGISPMVIAQTVDFALRGTKLSYLKKGGREVPITASFRHEDKEDMGDLDNVAMQGRTGRLVPLSQLVNKQKADTPQRIDRVDGKNVVRITASTFSKDLAGVKRDLAQLASTFDLPRGYDIQMGEELTELETSTRSFFQALVLALILIYVVMGALFESYLLPLSILTSVPLAFIGVYWSMYITGTPMDAVALIGAILMCGIVVNNGIVIVDHINQLRKRGMDREQAILEGGHHRFRPVLMTALTTILGCVPLAMGGTQVGEVAFNSLGRALIGGLTTGTFLTLFLVPVSYSLVDDLQEWFVDYVSDLVELRRRGEATRAP
jgi:HAE1 family hydrophobic/amphiphilic exporter-1